MFACLYVHGDCPPLGDQAATSSGGLSPTSALAARLLDVARGCSPRVERRGERLAIVDASGITRLFGGPRAFALQVEADARNAGLVLGVAVAATRTAASVLAATRGGVSVVLAGHEAAALAPIPLSVLGIVDEGYAEEAPASRRRRPSSSRHYRMAPQPGDPTPAGAADARPGKPVPPPDALATLERWGVHTLGALAALPRADLFERLGETGTRWQRLARGEDLRPLVREAEQERFEQAMALEWPIEGLEPLSFVLARLFDALGAQLERKDRGAVVVHVWLKLVTREVYHRALELAAPMREPKVLRTLALLDLESHPPSAGIDEVRIAVEPAPGRVVQFSLIEKPLPSPDTLATLTARLSALVGRGRCGSPVFEDTHRTGAIGLGPFVPEGVHGGGKVQGACTVQSAGRGQRGGVHGAAGQVPGAGTEQGAGKSTLPQDGTVRTVPLAPVSPWPGPRAALRLYRRPITARVALAGARPARVTTSAPTLAGGRVQQASGPWLASGNWWTDRAWDDEEWDVALADGGIYRLTRDRHTGRWAIAGQWD